MAMKRFKQAVRWLVRVMLGLTGLYLVVFASVYLLLHDERVQNQLVPYLNQTLTRALKTDVRVGRVSLDLFDQIVLEDLYWADRQNIPMITVKKLKVSMISMPTVALLSNTNRTKRFYARSVELEDAYVNLYMLKGTGNLNIDEVIAALSDPNAPPDTTPSPLLVFDFPNVRLHNARFHLTDSNATDPKSLLAKPKKFNFQNLRLKDIDIHAGLKINESGCVFFSCYDLSAYDTNADLRLDGFTTKFASVEEILHNPKNPKDKDKADTVRYARFYDTRIRIGKSDLHFDLKMPGMTFNRLFKSGYNRKFHLTFDRSVLDFASLNYFAPEDVPLRGIVKVDGTIRGDYNEVRAQNLQLIYNDSTRIFADLKMDNYAGNTDEKLFMRFKVKNTYVRVKDLEYLLPDLKLPKEVRNVGSVLADGTFTGFVNDFVVKADLVTPLGKAETDLNLKFGDRPQDFYYKGYLKTENLNLDRIAETKLTDRLNFAGKVEGRSTDFASAEGKYVFKMGPSRWMNFDVDSCIGAVEIKGRKIKGAVIIKDPQGSFDGDLAADLSGTAPQFEFSGNFESWDLQHYDITPEKKYLFTAQAVGQLSGNRPDDLNGTAALQNVLFREGKRKLALRELNVTTDGNSPTYKNITVTGSHFELKALGNWTYENAVQIGKTIAQEVEYEIQGDTAGLHKYLKAKKPVHASMSLQFRALDMNPIFSFFDLPVRCADSSTVADIDLDFDENQFITVRLVTDSLTAGPAEGKKIDARFDLRSPAMSTGENYSFTLDGDLEAGSLTIDKAVTFPNVDFHPRLVRNDLTYNLRFGIDTLSNYLYIKGNGEIANKGIGISIFPNESKLLLKDSLFTFRDSNSVFFKDQTLKIHNLKLQNGNRLLTVEADIDPPKADLLTAQVRNLDLELLNKIVDIGFELQGTAELEADVFGLFQKPVIRADGTVKDIFINKLPMGSLTAKSDLNDPDKLRTEIAWRRESELIAEIKGFYDLNTPARPLHFELNGAGFPVELFEKFLSDAVYGLKGTVLFEQIKIAGSFAAPEITGEIFADVRLGLHALKQKFSLKDKITVEKNRFALNTFRVFNVNDETGKELPNQYADLTGELSHRNFSDLKYNLRIQNMNRFQIIKTGKNDNTVFYGTGIAEGGTVTVSGNLSRLKIATRDLRPAKGTILNIPVTTYEKKERLNYVKFVNRSKETAPSSETIEAESSLALEMDLDVAMNPNAEVNIIFDERIGDKIRASGNGELLMTLNPEGEFEMSGKYIIEKGNYLFTFQDLINKSFDISNGGYLRWTGNPFNPVIDLNAIFSVNANMKAWDTTLTATRVNVNMNMSGMLMQPEIKFNLEVPGIAQSSSPGIAYTMRQIQADQQELNRQVFSIIALGSVAPVGRFFGQSAGNTATAGATSTLTEFLSNQLNAIIAQTISDNIGVSFNWSNNNQLMLNIRTTILNDRITFERNGAITSAAGRDITLGNISVQFRILPGENSSARKTGILAAEVFNRESFISQNINAGTGTRGVGIFYRKEFDVVQPEKKKVNAQKKEKKKKASGSKAK